MGNLSLVLIHSGLHKKAFRYPPLIAGNPSYLKFISFYDIKALLQKWLNICSFQVVLCRNLDWRNLLYDMTITFLFITVLLHFYTSLLFMLSEDTRFLL